MSLWYGEELTGSVSLTNQYYQLEEDSRFAALSAAPVGSETDIINFTVPASGPLIIDSIIFGGNDNGVFKLLLNGAVNLIVRNAWTKRTVPVPMGKTRVASGVVVRLTVTNMGKNANEFEARINAKLG